MINWLAAAGVTVTALVTTPPRPLALLAYTSSMYPIAALFNVGLEKTATPLDAVPVVGPPSVVPPGLFAITTVTGPLNEVMGLPEPSSAVTVRLKVLPAVMLL